MSVDIRRSYPKMALQYQDVQYKHSVSKSNKCVHFVCSLLPEIRLFTELNTAGRKTLADHTINHAENAEILSDKSSHEVELKFYNMCVFAHACTCMRERE